MGQQLALTACGYQESSQAEPQPHPDQEVTALIGDLRQIGRRLQSARTLDHPRVRAALGQLDNELAAVLGQSRGRHRIQVSGTNLMSDPLAPNTSAEFVTALRQYRASNGNTSFRQMAIRARHVVPHSAMCMALNCEQLPPLKVVLAIVAGCGGGIVDQERFATAWHYLAKNRAQAI